MTVEVREAYYYIIQGQAINADTAVFNQETRFYVISGFGGGTAIPTSNTYAVETTFFAIQTGVPRAPDVRVQRTGLWQIEGGSVIGRTGVYQSTGFLVEGGIPDQTKTLVYRTGTWVITTAPVN